MEASVWIYAATWALMATIFAVCERGPDCRRLADSPTSSGWSVAGVIYAGVPVSCVPTRQDVPAKWAARPTDVWSMLDSEGEAFWLQVIEEDF